MKLTLVSIPRTDTHPCPIFAYTSCDGFNDFQTEPIPILDASTVSVRPLIRNILDELINQVSISSVDFYTVEPRFDRVLGGSYELLDVILNLELRHLPWGAVLGMQRDGGWSDERESFNLEYLGFCAPAKGPHLEVDK